MKWKIGALVLTGIVLAGVSASGSKGKDAGGTVGRIRDVLKEEGELVEKVDKSEEDWKTQLNPEQYHVLREKGTERAFSGEYHDHKADGSYVCAGCGLDLFASETKFDSGTGWPSFWKPVAEDHVDEKSDRSFFMKRTEVVCARCGGHLGHVFDDGPAPTHQRYCINSAALKFKPE